MGLSAHGKATSAAEVTNISSHGVWLLAHDQEQRTLLPAKWPTIILILPVFLVMIGCAPPYHSGPVSDHFDGQRFHNEGPPRDVGFWDALRLLLTRETPQWPEKVDITPDHPPATVEGGMLRISCVGHATFLIQTRGLNILTDPIWSERASPFTWIGPQRVTAPGVVFDDLPPIDVVLISHNHYDHLDLATIEPLWERDRPRIIVPLGNDTIIQRQHPDIQVEAYDWEDELTLSDQVRLKLVPAYHWSGRGLLDRYRALWASFLLKTPDGNLYFVGDSGWGEGRSFQDAAERFQPIRLAILPIGDYKPQWFMAHSHMNPDEAVQAHLTLGAKQSIGSHFGTFSLSETGYTEPLQDLDVARMQHGITEEEFSALAPGEFRYIPPVQPEKMVK